MNAVTIAVDLAYLVAAAGFVVALHLMNSPATARRGSRLSWTSSSGPPRSPAR
jgi:NAD/NADP transhydrogenase beta subunit